MNLKKTIYVNNFELKDVKVSRYCDDITLNTVISQYLYFNVAIKVMEEIIENYKITDYSNNKFLITINHLFLQKNHDEIKTLDELLERLKETKDFYKEQYFIFTKDGSFSKDLGCLKIPFLDINYFIEKCKILTDTYYSYVVFIDNKNNFSYLNEEFINKISNDFINYRISSDDTYLDRKNLEKLRKKF